MVGLTVEDLNTLQIPEPYHKAAIKITVLLLQICNPTYKKIQTLHIHWHKLGILAVGCTQVVPYQIGII